ncbi:uncharacterized protein LOC131892999 [Tigriopus californicus]|uniref:uncharacterized protein LOC131892999 n=1 Tax=Tigriopus californicus TaxID=6832 RepID=UPI0027DA5311|nr:uncharacterized protein LOC131892999 [Tigriopus californicus]
MNLARTSPECVAMPLAIKLEETASQAMTKDAEALLPSDDNEYAQINDDKHAGEEELDAEFPASDQDEEDEEDEVWNESLDGLDLKSRTRVTRKRAKRAPGPAKANPALCDWCGKSLFNKYALKKHARVCPKNKNICDVDHDHNEIDLVFSTLHSARDHIGNEGLDSDFSIRSSNERTIRYMCHLNGSYKAKKSTKKILKEKCPAYMIIYKPAHQGFATLRGCLTHNHSQEIKKISAKTKQELKDLVKVGASRSVILKEFSQKAGSLKGRLPKDTDIQNMRKTEGTRCDTKAIRERDVATNLALFTRQPELRGFHYVNLVPPGSMMDLVVEKNLNLSQLGVVLMSEQQREVFRRHPKLLLIEKEKIKRLKLVVINFLILNPRGECSPIMNILCDAESPALLMEGLKILKQLEPQALSQLKVYVSDLSQFAKKAFQAEAPWVKRVLMDGAFEKLMKQRIKDKYLLDAILNLRVLTNKFEFSQRISQFYHCAQTEEMSYFLSNYGPEGKYSPSVEWARCHAPGVPTSIDIAEPYLTLFRRQLSTVDRMDICIEKLKHSTKIFYNELASLSGSQDPETMSKIQKEFNNLHFKKSAEEYFLEPADEIICAQEYCQVKCQRCPPQYCAHLFKCTCSHYAQNGICHHMHSHVNHPSVPPMLSADPNSQTYQRPPPVVGYEDSNPPPEPFMEHANHIPVAGPPHPILFDESVANLRMILSKLEHQGHVMSLVELRQVHEKSKDLMEILKSHPDL